MAVATALAASERIGGRGRDASVRRTDEFGSDGAAARASNAGRTIRERMEWTMAVSVAVMLDLS